MAFSEGGGGFLITAGRDNADPQAGERHGLAKEPPKISPQPKQGKGGNKSHINPVHRMGLGPLGRCQAVV